MSRLLYVDVIGGAAGDMLLAALLDAGAPVEAVREAVEAVVPGRFAIGTEEVRRGGLRARLLRIAPGPAAPPAGQEEAELPPRPFRDLVGAVERAPLPPGVRRRALAVLERMGDAEARVHGVDRSELSLHELGDDDTLLDVVGVAAALEAMGVDRVLVSPIPLGTGRAMAGRHAHGDIPLPATVTLELLRGFAVGGEGSDETVTPTAAAVFAALGAPAPEFPAMTLEAVGYGAGNDDPPDRANVVRVVVGVAPEPLPEDAVGAPAVRELVVLEANLDDLTPELVADASRALVEAGALDAWSTPVTMKKGRPGVVLSALGEPGAAARLARVFFEATSTFGVRAHTVRRSELERRTVSVSLAEGSVRVKVGLLGGRVVTVTPEHDDVAELARRTGRSVRDVYEEAAAAGRALRFAESEGPG